MGGEAGGHQEQEAELEEGDQGGGGWPGERHDGVILSQTCETEGCWDLESSVHTIFSAQTQSNICKIFKYKAKEFHYCQCNVF